MALKKSELYASLWKSCDELRGGMDASQYKDYVLVLLFVKYVSDKYANDPDGLIEVPPGGGQGRQGNRRPHQQDRRPAGGRQRSAQGGHQRRRFQRMLQRPEG